MKIKNPFKKKTFRLFHPASPGVRVTVRRNWFQQVLRSKDFATLGEVIKNNKKRMRDAENDL